LPSTYLLQHKHGKHNAANGRPLRKTRLPTLSNTETRVTVEDHQDQQPVVERVRAGASGSTPSAKPHQNPLKIPGPLDDKSPEIKPAQATRGCEIAKQKYCKPQCVGIETC